VYSDCTLYLSTVLLAVLTLHEIRSSFVIASSLMCHGVLRIACWKLYLTASVGKFIFCSTVEGCPDFLLQ